MTVIKNKFCSKYDVGSLALVEAYLKDLKNTDMSTFHHRNSNWNAQP